MRKKHAYETLARTIVNSENKPAEIAPGSEEQRALAWVITHRRITIKIDAMRLEDLVAVAQQIEDCW